MRASLEASRERVRGLEFLRRLAAGLVHETKNPLGVVRGFAERLTRDRLDEPAVQSSAAAILAETDRTVARLDEYLIRVPIYELEIFQSLTVGLPARIRVQEVELEGTVARLSPTTQAPDSCRRCPTPRML